MRTGPTALRWTLVAVAAWSAPALAWQVHVGTGFGEDRAQGGALGDVAQGYLISRPLSEDRFEAWLRARTVQVRGARDETVLTLVH